VSVLLTVVYMELISVVARGVLSGWPLTWKSDGIAKWSGKMEKVRGNHN